MTEKKKPSKAADSKLPKNVTGTDRSGAEDSDEEEPEVFEIPIVGDLGESESDVTEKLLEVPQGGECTLFFDCPGGSVYCAVSLMTLLRYRDIQATAVVTGECSSAALWPFAACQRRVVSPFSFFLFHPMRWQSEESVQLPEAAEWARHFGRLEDGMNQLLADFLGLPLEMIRNWMYPGRYVTGQELVDAGVAELFVLKP